jgi:hypothetical protein
MTFSGLDDSFYTLFTSSLSSPSRPSPTTTAEAEAFMAIDSPAPSATSDTSKMSGTSYFEVSRRSSLSSNSSALPELDNSQRPPQALRSETTLSPSLQPKATPVDALSRQVPKPTHDATLDEMLARPPQRWSLGHYVKNARETRIATLDKEQQAKAFQDAKKELLKAKEEMERLRTGRR